MTDCPNCGEPLTPKFLRNAVAKDIGSMTSEAKAKASRENGRLGGRPKLSGRGTNQKPQQQ
jgi:hypothetical protein